MVQRGYSASIFVLFASWALILGNVLKSTSVLEFRDARPIGAFHRNCETSFVMEHVSKPAELHIAPRQGVALALGGGFARGFAHLGVLQVLEQHHIPISHIAGTTLATVFRPPSPTTPPLSRILATARTIRFRDIARWSLS